MSELIENLLQIAAEAAVEVMSVYSRPFDVDFKAPEDPVTEADRRANDLICRRLAELYPGIPVVAEESPEGDWAHFRSSERVFFVDPVDGTREFVARNGEFVIMIGLLDGDSPTHGVLHAPALGQRWYGEVGRGAFEIDSEGVRHPLRLGVPPELSEARIVSSRSHRSSLLERALTAVGGREILPIGSAGLKGAAVVRGAADVYLAPEQAGCRWDSCAPEAIVRAAGGTYTDAHGVRLDYRAAELKNDRGIVAAAPELHARVIEQLRPLLAPTD
ncbi:MAG TPA: 3'(2'),5'-bisphosphate nucleotidase CysQ [Polyangiaceae bacterium]|nr:3'(2'),5'-bisphosphate nucleotidase CysQ [Polyangiaceae bacterium]